MSQTFGYPSQKPCRVCGGFDNNQSEPRFGYTVCEAHQSVLPAFLDQATEEYQRNANQGDAVIPPVTR